MVSAHYLRLFDRGPVDPDALQEPRRAFEVLVDPHFCSRNNEQGAPVPDRLVFYPDLWNGYDLGSVRVQADSVDIDLSAGLQVANDWTSSKFEYIFPRSGEWSVVVTAFWDEETMECRSHVDC